MSTPYIIERTPNGERLYDVYSRLMKERIVFLGTAVDAHVSNILIAQLLHLDSEDSEQRIELYINSPGGSVYSGLAIYDTMQMIAAPVHTTVVGLAASMGAFLLAAGEPGHRRALPNARIMIHQPSSATQGTAADIERGAKEVLLLRRKLNEMLMRNTGRPLIEIERHVDRDTWMSAEEAKAFGIIDGIVAPRKPR